jgi:predicted porin
MDDGPVTAQYRNMQLASNSTGFYADLSRAGSGRLNPSFALQQYVSADWAATSKLSFSALYIWIHSFSYDSTQCLVKVAGQSYDACAAADRVAQTSNGVGTSPGRAVSDLQVFWATVAYQVTPWANLQLAWINTAPQRKEDNSFRQGFISTDYNAFTSISVGATFSLSRIGEK